MCKSILAPLWVSLLLVACGNGDNGGGDFDASANAPDSAPGAPDARVPSGFTTEEEGQFVEPWGMAFLPDGRLLVTERAGALKLRQTDGTVGDITGVPTVAYGGQGGLGDIILHPDFASNQRVYLSWAEAGPSNTRGAVVGRATLSLDQSGGGSLDDLEVIWRQEPKVTGSGHYGHRMAFGPNGYLFITSGERQKFDPAQDMSGNLGKIVRLNDDGTLPADNPFQSDGETARQVWTLGHRNPYGIAFDAAGRLWEHEMGPSGGDELNLIIKGENYGYPLVSEGDHYNGDPIPDHDTRPEFEAPKVAWTPVISPSQMIIYDGNVYPNWWGDALISGLSSEAIIRVDLDGENASEAERWPMGERIRSIAVDPDGHVWVLQDGSSARLLRLVPTYED